MALPVVIAQQLPQAATSGFGDLLWPPLVTTLERRDLLRGRAQLLREELLILHGQLEQKDFLYSKPLGGNPLFSSCCHFISQSVSLSPLAFMLAHLGRAQWFIRTSAAALSNGTVKQRQRREWRGWNRTSTHTCAVKSSTGAMPSTSSAFTSVTEKGKREHLRACSDIWDHSNLQIKIFPLEGLYTHLYEQLLRFSHLLPTPERCCLMH